MKRFRLISVSLVFVISLALVAALAWLSARDESAELEPARAAARRNRGAAGGTARDAEAASRVRDFKRDRPVSTVEPEERPRLTLDQVVNLSFHGMTIPQALEFLHGLTKLDFRLTEAAIRAGAERWTLNGRYATIKLSAVLAVALGQHGLAYRVRDGTVWIGTRSEGPLDPEMVAAESALEAEEVQAIRHKLEVTKIDLEFTDETLYGILDFIQEFAKINIVIAAELRKEGIPDRKISISTRDLNLKHSLRLILLEYGLSYTFENRVLLITRAPEPEVRPVLEVHDVRDLLEPDADGDAHAEDLLASLRREVAPDSWTDREGEVSMQLTGENQLIVVHTPAVQNRVRAALTKMRTDHPR